MKTTFTTNPPLIMIDIGTQSFGIGWWVKGHWKTLNGWFNYGTHDYNGEWFAVRLGPLFYSYGPY